MIKTIKTPMLVLISFAALSACQSAPVRKPASADGPLAGPVIPEDFLAYPSLLAEVADLNDRAHTLGKNKVVNAYRGVDSFGDFNSYSERKIGDLGSVRSRFQAWADGIKPNAPFGRRVALETPVGITSEELRITDLKALPANFTLPYKRVAQHLVPLYNDVFADLASVDRKFRPKADDSAATDFYLNASLSCDGEFTLNKPWPEKDLKQVRQAEFRLYDSHQVGGRTVFIPSHELKSCELTLTNPFAGNQTGKMNIVREDQLFRTPALGNIANEAEVCVLPKYREAGVARSLFLTDQFAQLTCPRPVSELTPLDDPVDGVNAKVEMLLGYKLPREVIEAQNPYIDLDFSKAPKLDAILVSYLVFRADFYGTLLSRLLVWQAQHGATVRILVSKVISLKKDIAMYERMMAASPNIKVHLYKFHGKPFSKMGGWISALHRTDHVKVFMTLSESEPEHNEIIIGGRNIHDGFVFENPVDHSQYPEVVDYAGGDESWCHWNDFEVRVRSKEMVDTIAGQYFALYSQDHETYHVRPYSGQVHTASEVDEAWFASRDAQIRHFISIPYKDSHELEKLFVNMIDSSRKTLRISTPYFNLTKPLAEAFERAVDRGVEVQLITRIHLDGDTAGSLLGEVNKGAINKFYKQIKVYEYLVPKVILHSKFTLVDGEMAFVGSVNFNQRSFLHDMENGLLIHSPDFTHHMEGLFEKYKTQSRPIESKQKLNFFRQIVVHLGKKVF